MKRFAFVLGLAIVAATASQAQATIVYQYVADSNIYSGPAGTVTATVNFYLQETVSGGSASYIAKDGGLLDAAFQINRTAGTGFVASLATQTSSTGTFANGLGGVSGNFTAAGSQWVMQETTSTSATSGPLGVVTGNVTKVLLATGTFNLGTSPTTTLVLKRKNVGTNTQTFNSGTDLDLDQTLPDGTVIIGAGDVANQFPITLNTAITVPEPGSMALCGIAACSFGFGAWRRRQARKAAEAMVEQPVV